MSLQRTLITLAALIRDPRVAVETHIASGSNWLHGVKTVLAEGDGILCYEQQHVGWRHRPLITVLEALHVPIWTLSGFYPSSAPSPTRWLSKALFWSAVTVTLAGFFYLQTQLNIVADNLAKTTVLSLSVIVEIGLLFFWNSIFG